MLILWKYLNIIWSFISSPMSGVLAIGRGEFLFSVIWIVNPPTTRHSLLVGSLVFYLFTRSIMSKAEAKGRLDASMAHGMWQGKAAEQAGSASRKYRKVSEVRRLGVTADIVIFSSIRQSFPFTHELSLDRLWADWLTENHIRSGN